MIGRWLVAIVVLLSLFASASVGAQPTPEAQGLSLADLDALMDDEDESVGALFRTQALDLFLLASFLVLALWSFFNKSRKLKLVALVASVGYLGVTKGSLVSITDVFAFIEWSFPIFRYAVFWYVLVGFTVVSTVLWGRLYCGRICAFGALTQLLDQIVPARLRFEVPPAIERQCAYVKYGLLAAVVVYYIATRDNSIYRYVEPFWMFTFAGSTVMWTLLAALLLATVFVRNLYCRFLCPLGAALGLVSKVTVFRIKRWSECKSCKMCEKVCEWGAIQGPQIVLSECVRCDDCERLYADQEKCPHWLVQLNRRPGAAAGAPPG